MVSGTTVRVLVLPVFKRYWLWHAWKEAPVSTAPEKPWQEGHDLREKFSLLLGSIQRWGSKQGEQQWLRWQFRLFRRDFRGNQRGKLSRGFPSALRVGNG